MNYSADVIVADQLSLPEVYLWGCVGGLFAGVLLFIVPSMLGAHQQGKKMYLDRSNVYLVIGLIIVFSAFAGFATILVGGITGVPMALKVGFGAEGTIKGLTSGASEALRPPKNELPPGRE